MKQYTTMPLDQENAIAKLAQEHQAKVEQWQTKRKKAFTSFVKSVLQQDKRYTIAPFEDTRKPWFDILQKVYSNILSNVMLKREGIYADVVIHPAEPKYGIIVNAGSKMTSADLRCYPSPSLAWSMISIANELERQFVREVEWESNKHGQQIKQTKKVYKKRGSHV